MKALYALTLLLLLAPGASLAAAAAAAAPPAAKPAADTAKPKKAKKTKAAKPSVDAAKATAKDAAKADAKPADTKPADAKPADAKADLKDSAKPSDAKPAEPKTSETKATDAKAAADAATGETAKPVEAKDGANKDSATGSRAPVAPANDAKEPPAGAAGGESAAAGPAVRALSATVVDEAAKPQEEALRGDTTAAPAKKEEKPKHTIGVSGWLAPAFGMKYRPAALPKRKWDYGATSSAAGIGFSGEPIPRFSYTLDLVVDFKMIEAVTDVDFTEKSKEKESFAGTLMDTVVIGYQPIDPIKLEVGAMRIPFTIPMRSANTALMFPTRAGPNDVFLTGSDQGATATGDLFDGIFLTTIGAFNGRSLGLLPGTLGKNTRGLVYCLRSDLNPLGKFAFNEGDNSRGPLRLGVGGGLLYRGSTIYDASGYESADVRDLRMSASVRGAWQGFYLQAEYLRRQQTDSFTSRPKTANGAYVQASYLIAAMKSLSIKPIARFGYSVENEEIEPRSTAWLEGGLAFYPTIDPDNPHAMRFIIQYYGEQRLTEAETAHGAVGQLQFSF